MAEYSTKISETPQVSYLTTDHLGSPRVITNENGEVMSRKDYTAFGEENFTAERTSGLGYSGQSETRKGYTGYEKDDESGLDFAQARYYNSTHGRYTSVDPLTASASIKNPQTFNRYTYVLNSPYKFTDPLGLIPVTTVACGERCPNSGPYSEGPSGSRNPFGNQSTEEGVAGHEAAHAEQQQMSSDPTDTGGLLPEEGPPPIDCSNDLNSGCSSNIPTLQDPFRTPLPSTPQSGDSVPTSATTSVPGSATSVGPRGTDIRAQGDVVVRDQYGMRLQGDHYTLTESVLEIQSTSNVPSGFYDVQYFTSDNERVNRNVAYERTTGLTNGGNAVDNFRLTTNTTFDASHRFVLRQTLTVTNTRSGQQSVVAHNLIVYSRAGVRVINCNQGCR